MRVGIDLLSETGRPGGICTYVCAILRHLCRLTRPDELELVVFAHADWSPPLDAETRARAHVVRLPLRRLPASARRVAEHALLPRLARRHRVDLVHSVNNVLPRRLPAPGVVTVHDLSPFCVPERFGRLKHRYLTHWVPDSIRRAERVICVSRATRENVVLWVGDANTRRIDVVPNGVGDRFVPAPPPAVDDGALRRRLDLPQDFFLQLGLVEPGKNLETTSRALARVVERGVDARLVVAGAPTAHLASLETLWSRLGIASRIRYLGSVPSADLPGLYRSARAFVFPSRHEGFGIPVLEAFASGTPCITSTSTSLPEVAGRAALTTRATDVAGLARAMERLWRDEGLRELLRERGLRRAAKFSWEHTARGTLDVYRKALGIAPPSREAAQPEVVTS